jgi:HEAT repeat protein
MMIIKAFFLFVFIIFAGSPGITFNAVNTHPLELAELVKTWDSHPVTVQRQGFVTVDGANLKSRLDAAIKLGRAASTKFWTAYSFDVRPGVAVDLDWKGSKTSVNGTSISFDSTRETRNLGIFLLHEPGNDVVSRVEVYNLDRERDYSGYRVYWLGRASNDESLSLLQNLVEARLAGRTSEHATMAIALHDDPRVGGILKNFVQQSSIEKVRTTSAFWLGQVGGETAFLADLVRNENESGELRKQAAFAIGVSKDPNALSTLQNLYPSVAQRDVKNQIIFAASVNGDKDGAVDFLINVADKDADREARKQAIFWLGQKAGERSLGVLKEKVDSPDGDTEVQKQAVFAISQRSKDEAIPLLINIAKTHSKPEVRKQAIFWLGQTGDQRAVDFFKEILLK